MSKTHAQLLTAFKEATRNTDVSGTEFDFYINNTLPTFLRRLSRMGLDRSHLRFIPKLKLDLTADTWEYDWLTEAKYSSLSLDITAGVSAAITGAQSTYFIAPGDICTYDGTTYQILSTTATTFTVDTSVTNTAKGAYVYARPLYFTDCYLLESGGAAGLDEIKVQRSSEMLAPQASYMNAKHSKHNNPMFRVKGDKIEVSFVPDAGDYLHLFYVPEPVKFDNTNALMTALTNPTQLTDEANNALVWMAAKMYFTQKGDGEKQAVACGAIADDILGVAGLSKGMPEW